MNDAIIHRVAFFALLSTSALAQEQPRSLYGGTSVVFERAQLVKPLEETNTADDYALAPLLCPDNHRSLVTGKGRNANNVQLQLLLIPKAVSEAAKVRLNDASNG